MNASLGLHNLVGVDNQLLRQRLSTVLQSSGISLEYIGPSSGVLRWEPPLYSDTFFVVETCNDVALAVQLVNNIHTKFISRMDAGFEIILLLSKEAIDSNPSLCFWLVNDRAAVAGIWTPDMLGQIPLMIETHFERFPKTDEGEDNE